MAGVSLNSANCKQGQIMLRNDERWVVFMEAFVSFVPKKSPNVLTVDELRNALHGVVGTASAVHIFDQKKADEAVTLDFADYEIIDGKKYLVLLFSYTNKNGADPGFRHMATGANRTEGKKPGEAVAASAHLVISTVEKNFGGKTFWPALIEDVAGIGKTKMQAAVTAMIASALRFQFKNEDQKVQAANARFQLQGLDEESVQKDLKGGKLQYFVAIRDLKGEVRYDDAPLAASRETVRLKPVGDGLVDDIKGLFGKVAAAVKKRGYDRVRVHYSRKDGKGRSLTFGTHREDAEDFLIRRVEKITVESKDLTQIYAVPCKSLIRKMAGLLK